MPRQDLNLLYAKLDLCLLSERQGLFRQLQNLQRSKTTAGAISQLDAKLDQAIARAEQRAAHKPRCTYPEELPVSQKRDDILHAIQQHPVIVVCGETGSGKTTQLPKICLDAGLGVRGMIGHTQPRRLAARAVANRIADELHCELGSAVGYKVRFTDKVSSDSYIKLMTDGVLLAECNHDRYLNQYDCIIIDEAHERSLNIDFLLGYLKRLTQKRKDLKIIITSATIDPQRFSQHFNNAPIIEVSGRTYPVEVRYRPLQRHDEDESRDLQQGIVDAVDELSRISRDDILVFLSGERDIRDSARALAQQNLPNTDVLPLLARLSNAEQNKIFHGSNNRRIILATNVAETSLTLPGIKYVIDSGLARISRYSWRSKLQRLPIENISQSSANQRMGRCGRTSEGICIRLYAEQEFLLRDEFTEPEIKRTNLAAVILQMEHQRLGHIDDFPFVEAPDERLINDGYKLLHELGALDAARNVTSIGAQLALLPLDPRLGRMLIEADKEGALAETLIIVAALAVQDPRERPLDKQQAADAAHGALMDSRSDFLFYLNLWHAYHKQHVALSGNQLRNWCKKNFLSWTRLREWLDTQQQIGKLLKQLKFKQVDLDSDRELDYAALHRALLCGLLGNIGMKTDTQEYLTARNRRFNIFPGSGLYKKPPAWIMAAEVVETSRVYARVNARIDPAWILDKAAHLLKRNHDNPHWEKRAAQVSAFEQTSLYGLIISAQQKVNYARVNPIEAREIFIRNALVQADFECKADFFKHNQQLVHQLETLEAKSRRQNILVDDETLFRFYDTHIPAEVCNGASFNAWLKTLDADSRKQLFFTRDSLMQHDATHITAHQFPDHLQLDDVAYPLEYHFDPSQQRDGITLITPLAALNAIKATRCEWLVPGMLHSKLTELIRCLPKSLRRNFIPATDFAEACVQALQPGDTPLTTSLAAQLKKITGHDIPYDAWRPELVSAHLFMNFRVIDANGKTLAESRNLAALKQQLQAQSATAPPVVMVKQASSEPKEVGAEALDELKAEIEYNTQGIQLKAYPALVREANRVTLQYLDSRASAQSAHHEGLRQLFCNALGEQLRHLRARLPDIQQLCLLYSALGNCKSLQDDIIDCVIDRLFMTQAINSSAEFQTSLDAGRSELHAAAANLCRLLREILGSYCDIQQHIKKLPLHALDTASDIQQQLDALFPARFLLAIEFAWLEHYPRYLAAISKRLEKLGDNAARDRQLRLHFAALWQAYGKRQQQLVAQQRKSAQLNHYRWLLEEYRVSLFAQTLKTRVPVSEKRLQQYWKEIADA